LGVDWGLRLRDDGDSERTDRERRDMMEFEMVHEDGDYQVFKSTNHTDPDRIGTIIADFGINEYARYAALIEDQYEEEVDEDVRGFFRSFDEAQKYLETKVSMTVAAK
tara:strand:+ start:78 stop:401 length:324 start_codon:yes stop_codon:yes gene_type:complete